MTTISKELQLQKSSEVWTLLLSNIQNAFDDFKKQFQDFLSKELRKSNKERMELIRIVNSELNSIMWEERVIKMSQGEYQLYVEFLEIFQPKEYFGIEKVLIKYFQKKDTEALFLLILYKFKTIFENTNSAKYKNIDVWFEIFAQNLKDNFPDYSYICWEKVICKLEEEKPLDFPCLNDILRTAETFESSLPVKKIEFLKKLKLID